MPKHKVVLSAALTGAATTRAHCPHIPYTPVEIAEEARRAVDAGASIVHIHAREDDGMPSWRLEVFQAIHEEVRKRCPNVIINYSTGAIGLPPEDRIRHITELKPDMAALNMGSMNYAIYSPKTKQFHFDVVFENPFRDIEFFLTKMQEAGTLPEMESFDTGHLRNSQPFIDQGRLSGKRVYSLVMGVMGGIPASTENLVHQVSQVPADSHWQVIGISRKQWQLAAVAVTLKGHFRVGLEDNFYLPSGEMAKSNGECVEAGVTLARMLGAEIATIDEARASLGIPLRETV